MSERRIRVLVDSADADDVVIDDIIRKCIEASAHLRKLEFSSQKSDLSRAKQNIKDAKDLIIAFDKRVRGEVTDSVFAVGKEKNKNHKGNAHTLNN